MTNETKMPDEIWAVGNNGDAACGCGEWDDYSKDGTRYFSEPAIEQRAKVAAEKLNPVYSKAWYDMWINNPNVNTKDIQSWFDEEEAKRKQTAAIILATLKGETK